MLYLKNIEYNARNYKPDHKKIFNLQNYMVENKIIAITILIYVILRGGGVQVSRHPWLLGLVFTLDLK